MAFSFPLSLPLSALNRKLVLFIRITILNWPLLGYPHSLPHFPLLLKTSSSLQRCLTDHRASSIEECSESQTDKCQRLFSRWGNWGLESSVTGHKETEHVRLLVPVMAFFAALWLHPPCPLLSLGSTQTCHPPLAWGKVSLLWMTEVFRETFPIIKGIWKKTGTASQALKLTGLSWPFNCAGNQPSSQSSHPFRRGEGPRAEYPHPAWPCSTKGDLSIFLFQSISLPKHQGLPHKELQSQKGSRSSTTMSKPWA